MSLLLMQAQAQTAPSAPNVRPSDVPPAGYNAIYVEGVAVTVLPVEKLRQAASVRLYVYDFGECNHLNDFDRFSQNQLVEGGLALNAMQAQRMLMFVPHNLYAQGGSMCFNPHHGVVWFDQSGEELGRMAICFECGDVRLSIGAESFSYMPRMDLLRDFLEALGAPISLSRSCRRQMQIQTPWRAPVEKFCALESIRKRSAELLPKNWKALNFDRYQRSCVQDERTIRY